MNERAIVVTLSCRLQRKQLSSLSGDDLKSSVEIPPDKSRAGVDIQLRRGYGVTSRVGKARKVESRKGKNADEDVD
jgi:hypothetical protein